MVGLASKKIEIPSIKQVYMPEPRPAPDKDSEFGIVVLQDNSAGLYYAWMGDSQKGMNKRYRMQDFIGEHPMQLVELYRNDDEADRSLGMAALNAISQSVFRQSAYDLPVAADSIGELELQAGDHLGMVGFFPSLVRKLSQRDIRLTIIEKKQQVIGAHDELNISADLAVLGACNKVLSTASTLLNDSLDEVLDKCRSAERIVLVGPTAGFLPDALFRRGVNAIGGSQVVDVPLAIERLSREQGLGDAARKYLLRDFDYQTVLA